MRLITDNIPPQCRNCAACISSVNGGYCTMTRQYVEYRYRPICPEHINE